MTELRGIHAIRFPRFDFAPGGRVSARTLRDDLRGVSGLVVDATIGVTHFVEHVQRHLMPAIVPAPCARATRFVTGMVCGGIRFAARHIGSAVDAGLGALPLLDKTWTSSRRYESWVAALNGVVGDRLAESGNPLAMSMQLRHHGVALAPDRAVIENIVGQPAKKVLLLVHGLCRSDVHWNRGSHDHGARLAQALGYTPIYLRYNSGLHISQNGRLAADLIEAILNAWPVDVEEFAIVAHSMGGLVARSACDAAQSLGHEWRRHLRKLVFLGTPHHGAPLERGGHWLQSTIGRHAYTAAFTKLGELRSAGITDLRRASLRDEDWQDRNRFEDPLHPVRPMPLPAGVECYALAGALRIPHRRIVTELLGDGLVPVRSAFGDHDEADFALDIPAARRCVAHGVSHMALLQRGEVYSQLHGWLAPSKARRHGRSRAARNSAATRRV